MGCHSIQFASAGDIKNCDVTKNRKIYRYLTLSTDYILPLVSRTLSIYLFIEPKDKAYLLLRIGIFLQFRTNDSLFRSPIHPFRYFTGEFATEISYLLAVDCTTIKPLFVVTVRNGLLVYEKLGLTEVKPINLKESYLSVFISQTPSFTPGLVHKTIKSTGNPLTVSYRSENGLNATLRRIKLV